MRTASLIAILFFTSILQAAPRAPRPGIFERTVNSYFVVDGVKYHSVEQWKKSKNYKNMLLLREVEYALETFDEVHSYHNLSRGHDLDVIRQYNSNRTFYELYRCNKKAKI